MARSSAIIYTHYNLGVHLLMLGISEIFITGMQYGSILLIEP